MAQGPLDETRLEKIKSAAHARGLTADQLLAEIVDEYFVRLDELRTLIEEGVADIEAGRVHSADEVREHFEKYFARRDRSSA